MTPTTKRNVIWVAWWLALGLGVGVWIAGTQPAPAAAEYYAAYLLEILKYIPTDEVRMTFKAPERAATCEPVGWDDPASSGSTRY